jgi:hypothetical protein
MAIREEHTVVIERPVEVVFAFITLTRTTSRFGSRRP